MKSQHIHDFLKVTFGSVLLLAISIALVAVMGWLPEHPDQSSKSDPQAAITQGPYPAPDTGLSTTATSPCDDWFSFATSAPDDKKGMLEKQYKACIKASKETPVKVDLSSLPTIEPGKEPHKVVYSHKALSGEILETGFSDQPSTYLIVNQWGISDGDKTIIALAGSQQLDLSNHARLLEPPLPGVVIVEVRSMTNEILPDEGGVYFTPLKDGSVRIIDANSNYLFLVSSGGNVFSFDWKARKFMNAIPKQFSASKKAGNGSLVESNLNIQKEKGIFKKFDITNYWYQADEKLSVFAGAEVDNLDQGVLIISTAPPSSSSDKKAAVYRTPILDGALRIMSVEDNNIVLVSTSGLGFTFNIDQRSFTQVPSGSKNVIETYDISANSSELTFPTNTPRPTPSALPTSLHPAQN